MASRVGDVDRSVGRRVEPPPVSEAFARCHTLIELVESTVRRAAPEHGSPPAGPLLECRHAAVGAHCEVHDVARPRHVGRQLAEPRRINSRREHLEARARQPEKTVEVPEGVSQDQRTVASDAQCRNLPNARSLDGGRAAEVRLASGARAPQRNSLDPVRGRIDPDKARVSHSVHSSVRRCGDCAKSGKLCEPQRVALPETAGVANTREAVDDGTDRRGRPSRTIALVKHPRHGIQPVVVGDRESRNAGVPRVRSTQRVTGYFPHRKGQAHSIRRQLLVRVR